MRKSYYYLLRTQPPTVLRTRVGAKLPACKGEHRVPAWHRAWVVLVPGLAKL